MQNSENEFSRLEDILEEHIPKNKLDYVKKILFGPETPYVFFLSDLILLILIFNRKIDISKDIFEMAKAKNLELRGYRFDCPKEQTRPSRIVRVGIIQNRIVRPTTDSVEEQRKALHKRIEEILKIANLCHVNIICFQEAWSKYYLSNLVNIF